MELQSECDLETLHERIKEAREEAGMTVNQVADALGVSRTQVWRMENKSETLTAVRLFELADLFGVDPRRLLQGELAPDLSIRLHDRIGEAVLLVEECVHGLNARPSPELVRDAVLEVLRLESGQSLETQNQPIDPEKYRGLINLIFKQTKSS